MSKNRTVVPSNFSYFNKFLDRKVSLTPKVDEMVISVRERPEAESVSDLKSDIEAVAQSASVDGIAKSNTVHGIAVVKVSPSDESLEIARNEQEEFVNKIPAFIDEDGLTRYLVPDEITVQFEQDIDEKEALLTIESLDSFIVREQRTPGYYTVAVPEGSDAFETITKFSELDTVQFAEASEIGFDDALLTPPNDSRFSELWGLNNTGQTGGKPGADISVLQAWDTTKGNKNVVVAVIDTGMDLDHEDLLHNLEDRGTEDWDFASSDGSPDDSGSHGTHVCGTVGAVSNNQIGISGVAPESKLMPLRINLTAGMNANRADALNFVASKAGSNNSKKYVVNCSWRASGTYAAILRAIDNAVSNGALVVFAAGNSSRDMDVQAPQYPGVYPNAICVAALNADDQRAYFSNVGSQVDVSAPGKDILSTVPDSKYDTKSGTSMAAPHVAGVIALIWSANMNLSNHEVRQILESSCDDIRSTNPTLNGKLGRGRVNAHRAVLVATST